MHVSAATATRRSVVGGSIAGVLACTAAIILIPATVGSTLSSPFLPHVYCYLYDKNLIALHLGSDAVIWLSYVSIALTLGYLVRRTQREIPFSWMFLAFGAFIIACGFTHFMEMVVLWKPLYGLAGDVKLVTALASLVTAIALPPLVPQIQSMISSASLSEDRGLRLEQANQELHDLSARLLRAQDGERRRIARELHDGVGQYLAAMKMSFDVALSEDEDSDAVRESLSDRRDLLERCTMEIRTMSYLLQPLLEEMGLASAARWFVEGFTERSGITIDLDMPAQFDRLPPATEVVLFRVMQESLTNVHRHSGSKRAKIYLTIDSGNAVLTIQDQGRGFGDRLKEPTKVGVGIAGMRERVRELGGEFEIDSTPGGSTVKATMPSEEKRSNAASHSSRR
jgi:signal transduction histidine kinase